MTDDERINIDRLDNYCPECEHPYRGFGFELSEQSLSMPISSLSPECTQLTVIQAVSPPNAQIFNVCWNEKGKLGTGSCPIPTSMPAVKSGTIIDIRTDIANSGTTGRVMAVFKIDGVSQYTDTNISLGTYPSGGLWSPVYSGYTMPTKNVTLVVEAHNWDASKSAWVLGHTKSFTISMTAAGCTGIELFPYSASIKQGEKVDMAAGVIPGNVAFTVTFKDRAGAILGTCKTSGTGTATGGSSCSFTWDSAGKSAGTYYAKAYADSCISTESVIVVGVAIRQWNFGVTVKDSATGSLLSGATVMAATVGGASQSKTTDTNGFATFRMDEGTINVSISKSGYNTYSTAESLYMDRNITYSVVPIPPTPTVGNIEFVSIPVGATILIDGKTTGQITPVVITGISAGEHTWTLKLTGYNDSSSKVIVLSGATVSVYTTMTPVTPTAGSLNITSTPMGASVWIDGKDMKVTTSGATIITDIPPGSHNYVLTMTGFQDAKGTFDIKAGQTAYLDVKLIPLTTIGALEISSEPSGARVYVDDTDTQRVTPATITNLIADGHRYTLKLSGYKDSSGGFNIETGKTTTVSIVLEKTAVGMESVAIAGIAGLALLALMRKK
jgi:hypothetical protein